MAVLVVKPASIAFIGGSVIITFAVTGEDVLCTRMPTVRLPLTRECMKIDLHSVDHGYFGVHWQMN